MNTRKTLAPSHDTRHRAETLSCPPMHPFLVDLFVSRSESQAMIGFEN